MSGSAPFGYRYVHGFLWPEGDTACANVTFDNVSDVDMAIEHCRSMRTAVQAGGNTGVWPDYLCRKFRRIYTFEADPANFRCLCANAPAENVFKFNAALGSARGTVGMDRNPKNCGSYQVDGAGPIPVLRIDDLGLDECDFLQLDIEGMEYHALVGAEATLVRCRPVVMIEDKGLSERYGVQRGAAGEYLRTLGAKQVGEIHRDLIFTW